MKPTAHLCAWCVLHVAVGGAALGADASPKIDSAWMAEAKETASAVRDIITMGVEAGQKERIYIEFGASLTKGRLSSASGEGIEVATTTATISLPWARISPKRLYLIGKPYVPADDAYFRLRLGRYCIVHGLQSQARDELAAAAALDPSLNESAREAESLLDGQRSDRLKRNMPSAPKRRAARAKPKRHSVPAVGKVAEVLTVLGRRHFMLGVTCGPDTKWIKETQAQGCRWDMRYQYLSGGVTAKRTWKEWNSPPGAFASSYMRGSDRAGTVPVFSWYQMLHSSPGAGGEVQGNKASCENTNTMRRYFGDVKLFMEVAAKYGKPVILHVEPDLWGFFLNAGEFRPNTPNGVRVMVKATGMPELSGCEDTMAGFGKGFVALRDTYAPNVLLGWHASKWGNPSTKKTADAIKACGSWDIIFVDPSDRDSAWKIAHNYHVGGAWWSENDFVSFRNWSGQLHKLTGLPLIAWQIPVGNTIMAACNNTEGHYMDNRPQHWLENYPRNPNILAWARSGFIALLFGGGAGGCTWFGDGGDGVTNPTPVEGNRGETSQFADDDGGYLRMRGSTYYRSPLQFDLSRAKRARR